MRESWKYNVGDVIVDSRGVLTVVDRADNVDAPEYKVAGTLDGEATVGWVPAASLEAGDGTVVATVAVVHEAEADIIVP